MNTTTENLTTPLTENQAQMLNELARASVNLRTYLQEVIDRAKGELERANNGHHMSGFSGDLFGQSRYQADGAAVKRETLITACFATGAPKEAISLALAKGRKSYGMEHPRFFETGETFDIVPEMHE